MLEPWITVGIFVASQIILLAGIVTSLKGDTRILRVQMTDVQEELKQLGTILIELTRMDGRIDRNEERQIAQGKRIDNLEVRMNEWLGLKR